jgi:hypothetical protein
VSPLPKAEGYGALCTSIEALYRQAETSASRLAELQEQGKQAQEANQRLEKRNSELEAQIKDQRLQNSKREKDWRSAAKRFKVDVAKRDSNWKTTVRRVQAKAAKTLKNSLEHAQATASVRLKEKLAARDARWQTVVRRMGSEKQALQHQLARQKEAAQASTSVDAKRRRSMLLALTQEKRRCRSDTQARKLWAQVEASQKENAAAVAKIEALQRENALAVAQIKALQEENVHLVQRYA